MRRFISITAAALMAAALLLGAAPVKAGTMSWEDAAGEPATGAQGTLDITKVTLNFDGKTFSSTLDNPGDSAPHPDGESFTF